METIGITFLGTSNAVPTALRNHTSILLNYKNECLMFDCGEGTQRQFHKAKISQHKLTRIFITHWHGDHILGLPGLLQSLAMTNYPKKLKLYGPHGTNHYMSIIKELLKGIKIDLEVHEVNAGTIVEENEWKVIAETMNHDTPCLAYSFIIKDKLRLDKKKLKKFKIPNSPILGQLQAGKDVSFNGKKIKASQVTYKQLGKKVTIVLDTAFTEKAISLAKDSNLLISESSFSDEDKVKAKEYHHLTAKEAAIIAKKSKSKQLILTHISQRYEFNLKKIENEARKVFKNTKVVKDLDSIVL